MAWRNTSPIERSISSLLASAGARINGRMSKLPRIAAANSKKTDGQFISPKNHSAKGGPIT